MKNKIAPLADAIAIVRDGDTVAVSGFVGSGTPDALIAALETRFVETGSPRDLTLVFAAAPGDGKDQGLNRLAHAGLIKRAIGGHWALVPKLARMEPPECPNSRWLKASAFEQIDLKRPVAGYGRVESIENALSTTPC